MTQIGKPTKLIEAPAPVKTPAPAKPEAVPA